MYCLPLLIFNHAFEFQKSVCNGCYDFLILYFLMTAITIIVKCIYDCCIIHDITKSDAIHLLENSVIDDYG